MIRAWSLQKLPGTGLAFALSIAFAGPLAQAQQPPNPRRTPVPRTLLLPPKVVAGAQATLAVLDSLGRLLPNIEVDLPAGQKAVTDKTGRALFKAPAEPGTLVAKISGHSISASAAVVLPPVDPPPPSPGAGSGSGATAGPGAASVASYPHAVALHDRFTVEGYGFLGTADSNHVSLNDVPCLVVASSPASLVALPGPQLPVGDVSLHITAGGADAGKFLVSAVLLEFSGPTEAVTAGSVGTLVVHAHGTMQPLLLEVRNSSPGVIQLSKGNVQRVKTSGGEDNSALVEVKFLTGGDYSVSARLISAISHE